MDAEQNRTRRRDKGLHRKRHGMKINGKAAGLIMKNVILKRLKEKRESE